MKMGNPGLRLLTKKRFAPLFWTQFSVVFNDNMFRNALLFSIAFSQTSSFALSKDMLINLCAALFTLPFILFSSIAGQLADKLDKTKLIIYIKIFAIILSGLIFIGFHLENDGILIATLFLLGTQSAFFGPIKYSILPSHLNDSELVIGNGLVELGTFIGILFGTITGGLLMSINSHAGWWVAGTSFIFSLFGFIASLQIPKTIPAMPELKINWNIPKTTLNLIKLTTQNKAILGATLGISWFWSLGIVHLTQVPNFVSMYMHSNAQVATILISIFSIGIGIGSISCEKLSPPGGLNFGIIPAAAIGMLPFSIDLPLIYYSTTAENITPLLGVTEFFMTPSGCRVGLDLFFLGFFCGLFVVPLYVIIQRQSPIEQRGQIIAAGNVINTICMIITTVIIMLLFKLGLSIPQALLAFVILQIVVAVICYWVLTVNCLQFLGWIICCLLYKVSCKDLDNIPKHGPAIIASNHISYIDPVLIFCANTRPIRFIMDDWFYNLPIFNTICRHARAIPISYARNNPQLLAKAFDEIEKALNNGEIVGIFPEGAVTRNGKLNRFQSGLIKIISRTPTPVIPMAINGLWGSFFSWRYGMPMFHFPRRLLSIFALSPSKVRITAMPQIEPQRVNLDILRKTILAHLIDGHDISDEYPKLLQKYN